jgi:hypothetical protein
MDGTRSIHHCLLHLYLPELRPLPLAVMLNHPPALSIHPPVTRSSIVSCFPTATPLLHRNCPIWLLHSYICSQWSIGAPLISSTCLAIVNSAAILIKLDYLPTFSTPLSVILLIIHVKSYSLLLVSEAHSTTGH